jgi:hypothetical protein
MLYNVWRRLAQKAPSLESSPFPADVPKGMLQRDLGERWGSKQGGRTLGASDVGEDSSSGGEYIEAHPYDAPGRF